MRANHANAFEEADVSFAAALSDKERAAFDKWYKKRLSPRHKHHAHSYEVCFHPTGIGEAVIIRCGCGEETNISDYGAW